MKTTGDGPFRSSPVRKPESWWERHRSAHSTLAGAAYMVAFGVAFGVALVFGFGVSAALQSLAEAKSAMAHELCELNHGRFLRMARSRMATSRGVDVVICAMPSGTRTFVVATGEPMGESCQCESCQ